MLDLAPSSRLCGQAAAQGKIGLGERFLLNGWKFGGSPCPSFLAILFLLLLPPFIAFFLAYLLGKQTRRLGSLFPCFLYRHDRNSPVRFTAASAYPASRRQLGFLEGLKWRVETSDPINISNDLFLFCFNLSSHSCRKDSSRIFLFFFRKRQLRESKRANTEQANANTGRDALTPIYEPCFLLVVEAPPRANLALSAQNRSASIKQRDG